MKDLFLTNYTETKFISKLKESINKCTSFYFSVSFIKKAGLILIEHEIEEALKRGAKGFLLTSTYQNFTDIASLDLFYQWMNKYPNFLCHLDLESFGENGFHTKGYIFEYNGEFELVVGSSNITRFALLKNIEWNVSLYSKEEFTSYKDIIKEFNYLWDNTFLLSQELINSYKVRLDYAIEKWDMDFVDPINSKIIPNSMQRKALKELRRYRDMGISKALVISATGSGKTYLAAFDAKYYDAKRVLFVCHRDKILEDAKNTFAKVFGQTKTYGLFVGSKKELDCDFVFASNIMLANHLDLFDINEFDYICIDEAHHSTTSTCRKIIDYFRPGFLLGITATPERMDNEDVFSLFDKNVPYELRLRDAIVNDLVVPFHYYGIRDKYVDYQLKDNFKIAHEIIKDSNIEFICQEIEKHKPKGKIKAIAFCTDVEHAKNMAYKFTIEGYQAYALTSKNTLGERIKIFNDLQDDKNNLQIICAVDILNEGVDIPQINLVLFLRPTESQTIFLQQLGRGLRKYEGKEYVTVLDFIGNNYERSIQIAMALGTLGKSTIIEKRYLMDLVREDFLSLNIPGVLINIDELSKEEIIYHIRNQNFNTKDFLIKDYQNFKKYLRVYGYPSHMDYINSDCAPDLIRIIKSKINNKKNKSYYSFLKKIKEEALPLFTNEQINFIDKLEELLPIVRCDEYIIINQLINSNLDINELTGYNTKVTKKTLNNALRLLKKDGLLSDDNKLMLNEINGDFLEYLNGAIEYGLTRYEIEFGDYDGIFKKYSNYYKEQIMRILCQENLMFMKVTKFDKNVAYVFVGLKKDKTKLERTNYKDKFLSSKIFQWESENNTTINNSTGKKLMNTEVVHLFVRKMDDEDGITLPFTYFGTGRFSNVRESFVEVLSSDKMTSNTPTLLFDIILDKEVPKEYFFDFEIPEN